VPLAALLSRRHLAPWPAVVGTLFLAVNPMSNQFAAEIKQYSTDECVSVVLLLVLSRLAASGWLATRSNVTLLSSAGALAVLFSLPSCFVLAGVGGVCIACAWRAGARRDARTFAAVAAGWLLLFTLGYGLLYSHAATSPYLKEFWAGSYLDLLPFSPEALRADKEVLRRLVGPFFGLPGGWRAWIAAASLTIGTVRLFRQSRVLLGAVVMTFGLAGLASGLGIYPLVERQAMFLTPVLALLMGASVAPWARRSISGALVAAGLLLLAGSTTWRTRIVGEDREAIRTVLSRVSDRFEAGDTIYVYCATTNQFAYYREHRPDVVRLASPLLLMPARQPGLRANHACSPSFAVREQATAEELDRLGREHTGRFWLVLSHGTGVDPRAFFAALERHGDLGDAIDEPGALARLYTLPRSDGLPAFRPARGAPGPGPRPR
jgi:MFS family permease